MTSCFLFIEHLNKEGCLSLRLNNQGLADVPLAQRSFAEIKTLQTKAKTFIVVPQDHFSLYQLALAWLADRKAREAIPFALEDKLAQNVDTLHCAFARNYYQNGHYLVAVGDKVYLQELIALLDSHNINFNILTLDWFALKNQEIAVMENYLLVNDEIFQGAISPDLSPFYFGKWSEKPTIYSFTNSNKSLVTISEAQLTEIEASSYTWLAQRLQKLNPMNLSQGELRPSRIYTTTKRWFQAAIGMSLLWLLSLIVANMVTIYFLNKEIAAADNKIAGIYHEFFPQSPQVINPKFRINQLIKANQGKADSAFWLLLNKLAKVFQGSPALIEQLRFQQQSFLITLTTKNFAQLEELQTSLQENKVKVQQNQAFTRDGRVISTLELS
jgi:general secretion pathway protein L